MGGEEQEKKENLTANIWMTEYLNCVANPEVILPESYNFSIMREK